MLLIHVGHTTCSILTVLRITKIRETGTASELLVEGHLTETSAPDLIAVCAPDLTAGRQVLLDLSGLQFADADGLSALRALLERGAVPSRCTDFVKCLLEAK